MGLLKLIARCSFYSLPITFVCFAGCGKNSEQDLRSDTMLVNGALVSSGQYKSVVQVAVDMGGGSRASCTASIVSDSTLLTAAHCLVEDSGQSAAQAIAILPEGEIPEGRIVLHPSYSDSQLENDVALVVFPANTFREYTAMPVSKRLPNSGEKIVIVGFGKSDHFDPASGGKKRYGYNTITHVDERISFQGQLRTTDSLGSNVLNSQGDSGGPMMNADLQVIGVSSSLTTPAPSDETATGHYTNLGHPLVRQFMQANGF